VNIEGLVQVLKDPIDNGRFKAAVSYCL
jgi:hypothetical protein